MRICLFIFFLLFEGMCSAQGQHSNDPYIIVLGIAQDAGYPQAGCLEDCCKRAWNDPSQKRLVASLALVDPATKNWWLFDATPDITEQLQLFRKITHSEYAVLPKAVFLTHGHIGHYTGLMYFGREVMNTSGLTVYAMPRMQSFLQNNGPWSQLVQLKNISISSLANDKTVSLAPGIDVTPFLVPHRDEFTETVGFTITHKDFKLIFIPDIDKWDKWDRSINTVVKNSSIALLDGTFFSDKELKGRSMSEIPHPFVQESFTQFEGLTAVEKKKIIFIHLNHTNPLLDPSSKAYTETSSKGFSVAKQGQKIEMK